MWVLERPWNGYLRGCGDAGWLNEPVSNGGIVCSTACSMPSGFGDDTGAAPPLPRGRRACRPRTSLSHALQCGQAQAQHGALHHRSPSAPNARVNPETPYAAETWSVGWGQGLFVDWLRVYKEEKAFYSSEMVWVEQALMQLRRSTSQLPQPNSLQTTSCCFLLLKLCASLGTHCWDLLKALCGEVFRAVFADWGEVAGQLSTAASPKSVDLEALFVGRHTFADELRAEKGARQEEAERLQLAHKHREQALLQSTAVHEEELAGWQRFALRSYFSRWRNHALRTRTTRVAVDQLCRRYRNLSDRFTKEKAMLQWKFYLSCCKRRNMLNNVEKEVLQARTTVANAELSCRELTSQAQQQRQHFDHVIIDLHAHYREEVSEYNQFTAQLETDIQQLLDDNGRLLDQLAHFKRLAHRWATVAHDMLRDLHGAEPTLHPTDLLHDPSGEAPRTPAQLLTCPSGVDEVLMRWVNAHLRMAAAPDGPLQVENFGADLRDGRVYTALVMHLFPDLPAAPQHPLDTHGPVRAAMAALQRAGVPHVLDVRDVIAGDPAKHALFLGSLLHYYALTRWMRQGEGSAALAEPLRHAPEPTSAEDPRECDVLSAEEREYRSHVAAEEQAIAEAKGEVALIMDDEMWTLEQAKVRDMARRLWTYRRPRERQRTQRELERSPFPADWRPGTVAADFRRALHTARAWAYLGYWCQADLMARVLRLRIASDDTIQLLDRRRDRAVAAMLPPPTPPEEAASGRQLLGDDALAAITQVVHRYFDALQHIYHYYSALDEGPWLTYSGFQQLCKDANLMTELRDRLVQLRFFPHARPRYPGTPSAGLRSPKGSSPTRTIPAVPPNQFLACLLHVALARYGGHPRAALTRLVESDVLPNAKQCLTEDLKSAVRLLSVQEVLRRNEAVLRRAFGFYASGGDGNTAGLTLADLQQQLADAKLLGGPSSLAPELPVVFSVAQDEYICNTNSTQPAALSFNEWVDAVVCIALARHPQPFLPVAQRLAAFLGQFLPAVAAPRPSAPALVAERRARVPAAL